MPRYEYRCRDCGQDLEVVQSFTDDPLSECPHCEGSLRKVFSPIGIAFKGSGFYKTDNRSSSRTSSGNGGRSADGGDADSGTGDSGGSDGSDGSSEASSSGSGSDGGSDGREAASSSTS